MEGVHDLRSAGGGEQMLLERRRRDRGAPTSTLVEAAHRRPEGREARKTGDAAEEATAVGVGVRRRSPLKRLAGAEDDRRGKEVERFDVVGAGVPEGRKAFVLPCVGLGGRRDPPREPGVEGLVSERPGGGGRRAAVLHPTRRTVEEDDEPVAEEGSVVVLVRDEPRFRSLICAARSSGPPASFHASIATVVPETGSTTVPVACCTVSLARTSTRGERGPNRSGKSTDQWFGPSSVTAPLVMSECAARVPATMISRWNGNWSKMRLEGIQASR